MKIPMIALLCFGAVFADEPQAEFILARKGWEDDVGMRVEGKYSRKSRSGKMKVMMEDGWTSGTMVGNDKASLIIEKTTADSYRIEYGTIVSKYRMFFDGEKTQQSDEMPLSQKVVRVERKDGSWSARIIEGDLEDIDEADLERDLKMVGTTFNDNYAAKFYGFNPRKIGESWELEAPVLPGMEPYKVLEGKATVLFEKVDTFQEKKCAFLKVTYDVTTDHSDEFESTMRLVGEGTIVRSLERHFDFRFQASGREFTSHKMEDEISMKSEGKFEVLQEVNILPSTKK